MPGRENHFVPQFYLRAFTVDGRSTNCFNFARGKLIRQASVKHQCSRHNFHGFSPSLEDHLGNLEGHVSPIIKTIRSKRHLPNRGSDPWSWLLAYVVYQKIRTPRAAKGYSTIANYLTEDLGQERPPDDPTRKHPVAATFGVGSHLIAAAADLEMHLLCNDTSREFITSDDPVVAHNQYCEGVKHTGVLGWNCRGFQAFLPLSPREMLVLFDEDVYKIGESHKGSHVTAIRDECDVEVINSLQVLNADQNAYFANAAGDGRLAQECFRLSAKRHAARWTFVETKRVSSDDGRSSSIVGHFEHMLPVRLDFGVIGINKRAKEIPLIERARMLRKPRKVESGSAGPSFSTGSYTRYPVDKIKRR